MARRDPNGLYDAVTVTAGLGLLSYIFLIRPYVEDPALSKFAGRVSDSGEGRWTIAAGIDEGVPVPVLSAALYQRFSSRGEGDFADKLVSAMRYEFGGHLEKSAK